MRKSVTYDTKVSYLRKWFKYGLKAQKLLGASALSGRVGQNLRKFCRLFKNLTNWFSFAVWLRQPTVLPFASPLF